MAKLEIGDKAPNFILLDQNEASHSLTDYLGKWILLYFYPKDNTPGCTKEACELRNSYTEYNKNNITILGVSTDSSKSHKGFADKNNLPFTLLADSDKKVVTLYNVQGVKKIFGKEFNGTKRISYLINPEGNIAKIYLKVKPTEHASEVIADVLKKI
ncbi:MAG: thioredoxin-dependent thiol peroxidase [bacterium]|nr:thioredoxin-dependent thiol peroxidase [bacterium]